MTVTDIIYNSLTSTLQVTINKDDINLWDTSDGFRFVTMILTITNLSPISRLLFEKCFHSN